MAENPSEIVYYINIIGPCHSPELITVKLQISRNFISHTRAILWKHSIVGDVILLLR